MGLFANLGAEGLEETQDRIGGGFQPRETDAYDMNITMAYAGKSQGGAQSVTLLGQLNDGREYRETLWVTNKKGENYFLNKDDPTKKVGLPGFTIVEEICLVTTDAPLSAQPTEEKLVKIYDYEQKKEVPTNVPVLTSLIGQTVTLGIGKVLENKSVKNATTGQYDAIADTREINVIEKVFHHESKMTVPEARRDAKLISEGKQPEGSSFFAAWVERNKGQTRDKREIKDGGDAGSAGRPTGAPAAGAGAPAPKTSLFGNKA
jgi:hypothetical protein